MTSSTLGVRKIVAFNWPWYALAVLANLSAAVLLASPNLPSVLSVVTYGALGVGNGWLATSLLVSHWVYDRSALARGAWLDELDARPRDVAVLHAGQDEASAFVRRRLPGASLLVFDFYDSRHNTEASLQRARKAARAHHEPVTPVRLDQLPLADAVLDVIIVAFAAHEIRKPERREAFFRELRRVLRPSGVVLVVEHLRDGYNALAYGPGALHFLSRRAWLAAFAAAELRVVAQTRYTPFVSCFRLARNQ